MIAPFDATPAPDDSTLRAIARLDLSHVDTWVFDLDNTLYPHESRVWPQVDARISLFLSEYLGLDGLSARALQKHYYHTYGTTLKGLMIEYGLSAREFLDFVHEIDLTELDPNPELAARIAALPGRKLIMTNGSQAHARNVAGKLGLLHAIEGIFDIEDAGLVPKPERAAYQKFFADHRVTPTSAIMFEDIAKNLAVPHEFGMRTVLVVPATVDPYRDAHEQAVEVAPYIDAVTSDLAGFLAAFEDRAGV